MSNDTDRVIVTSCEAAGGGMQASHREFPEIRGEGTDADEAVSQLVNHLTRALDSALTNWRRDAIVHAIADAKAFHAPVS
jgi:hypothetical protein